MNNNENNIYNSANNTTGFNNASVNNTVANNNSTNVYTNVNNMNSPQVNPVNSQVDHMAAVSNLNKEEVMEEALSHTNQYTPFEVPKQEVIDTPKKENPKSAYILIAVIVIIMALFIVFLPQISKLFGW